MRQRTQRHQDAAELRVKDIRRKTRKRYSAEEKIRIVLFSSELASNLRTCSASIFRYQGAIEINTQSILDEKNKGNRHRIAANTNTQFGAQE